MRYPTPLLQATFLRRYQRFFVDARLADGTDVTAHCPNTWSMLGLIREGAPCLLLPVDAPHRKLRFTLEAIRVGRSWVGAHPIRANTVGREAIERGMVADVRGIRHIRHEVPYGRASRADLLVEVARGAPWYVEIKSASLATGDTSRFPDAVTARGLKHLDELVRVVRDGARALMLFVATRADVSEFRAAHEIDPLYAERLVDAARQGVRVRAITSRVTRRTMTPVEPIPVRLGRQPSSGVSSTAP